MNIKIDWYLLLSIAILWLFHQAEVFLLWYCFALLHEFAHMLMAWLLGISTQEVYLLPFGVNAKIAFGHHKGKEILIAFAGPFLSLLLAWLLPAYRIPNLVIAGVNLLPIYPLDGGRIAKHSFTFFFRHDKGRRSLYQGSEKLCVGADFAECVFDCATTKLSIFVALLLFVSNGGRRNQTRSYS